MVDKMHNVKLIMVTSKNHMPRARKIFNNIYQKKILIARVKDYLKIGENQYNIIVWDNANNKSLDSLSLNIVSKFNDHKMCICGVARGKERAF